MEVEKKARYDRDKNKVFLTVSEKGEIEQPMENGKEVVGYTENRFEQEFNPEYIKKTYKNLNGQINQMERNLKTLRQKKEKIDIDYEYDDLVELKKKMEAIKKLGELEKTTDQIKSLENSIKNMKKDIATMKPIIKKLKK